LCKNQKKEVEFASSKEVNPKRREKRGNTPEGPELAGAKGKKKSKWSGPYRG